MRLQAYTQDELFSLGVAIVRSVTGVNYPFSERTFHRALVQVQALFAANANIETLRLIKGNSLDGLSGQLLDRRALQNSVAREPAAAARLAGRFIRNGPTGTAVAIPSNTIFLRPATATQSEVAFRSEAAATIQASDSQSNLIFGTCLATGADGNAIPSGATLALRSPMNDVSHFFTETASGGGVERESDASLRTRARDAKKGHGECTWAGIETLLTTVATDAGQQVAIAKLFEAFDEPSSLYTGLVYAIIDDGSGDSTLIAPTDDAYAYGGATWWVYESSGRDVYIHLPVSHLPYWDDDVDARIERNDSGSWVAIIENTDYYVDIDTGIIALVTPLTPGQKIRAQYTSYSGLIRTVAEYVNGIPGSGSIKGWRPVGYPIRIRAPYSSSSVTISAVLFFKDGWDSSFGRQLASTNVLAYVNSLGIGEAARYNVIAGIIYKTPGLDYITDLELNSGTSDVAPGNKFGVIRNTASDITL